MDWERSSRGSIERHQYHTAGDPLKEYILVLCTVLKVCVL